MLVLLKFVLQKHLIVELNKMRISKPCVREFFGQEHQNLREPLENEPSFERGERVRRQDYARECVRKRKLRSRVRAKKKSACECEDKPKQ